MIRRFTRAAAMAVAAPFLLFASSLAPQHVHEGEADHDHALAHSHFGPHEPDHHDSKTTEIEHDDEHVVWLDSPILHEGTFHLVRSLPAVSLTGARILFSTRWAAVEHDDAAPPHGPPKLARQHRGPPIPA